MGNIERLSKFACPRPVAALPCHMCRPSALINIERNLLEAILKRSITTDLIPQRTERFDESSYSHLLRNRQRPVRCRIVDGPPEAVLLACGPCNAVVFLCFRTGHAMILRRELRKVLILWHLVN